ncbi:hypothetical protein PI124_g20747 [Phytophthora idaei]|nr:hypothetical protein PI125_g10586 [Phytophthora idaei]KAG3153684.1 hypothetical protein PI126_g9957 [Phytophthora idaei]KAG3234196.1 hypothetical protein PI124_g20747 [Phytophthora idaei]
MPSTHLRNVQANPGLSCKGVCTVMVSNPVVATTLPKYQYKQEEDDDSNEL